MLWIMSFFWWAVGVNALYVITMSTALEMFNHENGNLVCHLLHLCLKIYTTLYVQRYGFFDYQVIIMLTAPRLIILTAPHLIMWMRNVRSLCSWLQPGFWTIFFKKHWSWLSYRNKGRVKLKAFKFRNSWWTWFIISNSLIMILMHTNIKLKNYLKTVWSWCSWILFEFWMMQF